MIGRAVPHRNRRHLFGWLLLAAALVIHLYVVVTIVDQPLAVSRSAPGERSLIWPLYNDTVHRIGPGADLFAVYHAAHALEQGRSLYGLDEEPRRTPYFFPFRYLPIVAQSIGRLSLVLPPLATYRFWVWFVEAILALVLFVLFRTTRNRSLFLVASTILLLSSPYLLELSMGQFTFVTFALFALGLLLVENRSGHRHATRSRIAGSLLYAASGLLKLLPILTVPALIRHRRYLLSLGIALSGLLGANLPYFLSHPGEWEAFRSANIIAPVGGTDAGNFALFHLIHLVLRDLGPPGIGDGWLNHAPIIYFAFIGITAGIVLVSPNRNPVLAALTMLLAHFVAYSQVWEHHMSGVILLGVVLLTSQVDSDERSILRGLPLAWIVILVLLAIPTPFALLDTAKNPHVWDPAGDFSPVSRYALVLSKAAPTFLFYLLCIGQLLRRGT